MMRLIISICLLLLPATALANDLPPIKEGLWKVEVRENGKNQQTLEQCISQAVFGDMIQAGQKLMGGACNDLVVKNKGGVYSTKVECKIMGSKMVSTAEMQGDFEKSYVAKTKTRMNPPMMGIGNSSQVATGSYQGKCSKGMKPGDMIMADGKKINVLDSINSAPKIGEMMKKMPDMSQVQKMLEKMGNR